MGDFSQVSLLSRQELGLAGIRGLSHSWSLPAMALAPTPWGKGKVSVGDPGLGVRNPGHKWSPPPCSPRTDLHSWVEPPLQWGCSSKNPNPLHRTAPTAPHPIRKLTSPNRPPLPVTKITIFKIHSRAFAYTRCADWNLKGDLQNAVCA